MSEANDIAGELEALGEEWFLEGTPMRQTIERAAEEIRLNDRIFGFLKVVRDSMKIVPFEPHRIDAPPGFADDFTLDKPGT